jgi:hypothetical protein
VPEDRQFELPQLGAWLDSELLAELCAGPPVGLERVRLTAGAVVREHQLSPGSLSERVLAHEGRQVGHELHVAAECQPGVEPMLLGEEPELREPLPLDGHERHERQSGEGFPAPERERLLQQSARPLRVAGRERRAPFGEAALEEHGVDLLWLGPEEVARPPRDDPLAAERAPQVVDVDLEGRLGSRGRIVGPEAVDGSLTRDSGVGVQEQQGQELPLLRGAELESAAVRGCLD